jgi:hypothetical protein
MHLQNCEHAPAHTTLQPRHAHEPSSLSTSIREAAKRESRVQKGLLHLLEGLRRASFVDEQLESMAVLLLIGCSYQKPREALMLRFDRSVSSSRENVPDSSLKRVDGSNGRTNTCGGELLCPRPPAVHLECEKHRPDSTFKNHEAIRKCSLELVKATASLPELPSTRSTKIFVVVPAGAAVTELNVPGFCPGNLKCTVTNIFFSVQSCEPVQTRCARTPAQSEKVSAPHAEVAVKAWSLLLKPVRAWHLAQSS